MAYLKDGGHDLQKAIKVLDEQGLASPTIDDISHAIAHLLKRHYHDHPLLATFLSACGCVSGRLKQTLLACLTPPNVHTKAQFMNLHRLVCWAQRLLQLSPPGRAAQDSTLAQLRAYLDHLPACKAFIQRFHADATPLLACPKLLKNRGLGHDTQADCLRLIETIPSAAVRREFADYLHQQLQTATRLGLDSVGLPISSDPIESLFGLAKQHGVGEVKDANRIALRLPALCGTPTRAEAQQVLAIRVAQQTELTGQLLSLTNRTYMDVGLLGGTGRSSDVRCCLTTGIWRRSTANKPMGMLSSFRVPKTGQIVVKHSPYQLITKKRKALHLKCSDRPRALNILCAIQHSNDLATSLIQKPVNG